MGNYSSKTTSGETSFDKETGEEVVKFNLFPEEEVITISDDLIESAQVDHFSSEQRIEELKRLIGEEFVNNKLEDRERMKAPLYDCGSVICATKDHKEFDGSFRGMLLMTCLMRKRSEFYQKAQKRKECIEDEYMDEILDIDGLLKKNSSSELKQKLKDFTEDFEYCVSKEDTNEHNLFLETYGLTVKMNEPYTDIIFNPERIEIFKSRYLPKETIIEKTKIEPELMEPYIYNPSSDSDEDFERKLLNLTQTDLLKHDIELVKQCYQNDQSKRSAKCLELYYDVMNIASLIVCKKEILLKSPPRIFPNIEDAAMNDFVVDGKCMKSLMKKHAGKVLPDMPAYEWEYFFVAEEN